MQVTIKKLCGRSFVEFTHTEQLPTFPEWSRVWPQANGTFETVRVFISKGKITGVDSHRVSGATAAFDHAGQARAIEMSEEFYVLCKQHAQKHLGIPELI